MSIDDHIKVRPALNAERACGLGDEELDVAVFRFTLGIPGFDDRQIPRIVGWTIAALVAINHVFGAQPTPGAQVRAEFLDLVLAVLCIVTPDIEDRLREVMPGRGRQQASATIPGAAQGFFLDPKLDDKTKNELAWMSFALLKNSNCCTIIVINDQGTALLARGAIGAGAVVTGNAEATLQKVSQSLPEALASIAGGKQQQTWFPDRQSISKAALDGCLCIPEGAQSLLIQPVGAGNNRPLIIAMSERPRGLSGKDQKWVSAVSSKLVGILGA
eukprot:jgi/Chrzof1/7003/Cz02g07090.t1_CCB2[v5.2]